MKLISSNLRTLISAFFTQTQSAQTWRAWKSVADTGITPEEAQTKYIELVEELKVKYGFDA
jgi:diazepam-binding inhibitor (GABA receptor modulating acyl-CoA-binding protein)